MRRTTNLSVALALAFSTASLVGCGDPGASDPKLLRVGHFPNITHAHGLVGHDATRTGKGRFETKLPSGTRIEWYVYNAGPSAMEALRLGAIDLSYVGPNPALNAYLKTAGNEVRVLAGATRGGAGLVVPAASTLAKPADFRGKRVATPQFGNTQDVAARSWFLRAGLKVTQTGGDVQIVPTNNPDQLALFKKGDVAAVWTVEPWVSILERDGGGKLIVEEKESVTTMLVASVRALKEKRAAVDGFVAAHRELTAWLTANPEDAKKAVAAAILAETRKEISADLLAHAWPRLSFQDAIDVKEFESFVTSAKEAGFDLPSHPLDRFIDRR